MFFFCLMPLYRIVLAIPHIKKKKSILAYTSPTEAKRVPLGSRRQYRNFAAKLIICAVRSPIDYSGGPQPL